MRTATTCGSRHLDPTEMRFLLMGFCSDSKGIQMKRVTGIGGIFFKAGRISLARDASGPFAWPVAAPIDFAGEANVSRIESRET